MSRHFQIESNLSLSGSNADVRIAVKPSEQLTLIENLYNTLKGKSSPDKRIYQLVKELKSAKGRSLVISGSNNTNVQTIINGINNLLNNYGSTLDIEKPCYLKKGNEKEVIDLISDMKSGKVGSLIMHGVNPAYTLPKSFDFVSALKLCKRRRIGAIRPDANRELFYKKDMGVLARAGFDYDLSKRVLNLELEEFQKLIKII